MSRSKRLPRWVVVGLASIVIVAAVLAGWLAHEVQPTQTVQAAGPSNDYPWGSATDCAKKFGIYSWCLNDNWLSPLGFGYRNCTDYAAYELNEQMGASKSNPKFTWSDVYVPDTAFPKGDGNAREWKQGLINRNHAGSVNGTPAVGAVAWWGPSPTVGSYGHVGIVASVSADHKTIVVFSYNAKGDGTFFADTISTTKPGWNKWPDAFLHIADAPASSGGSGYGSPSDYAGKIVQWDGDHKQQRTSWLVSADLKRYWIPDIQTYWCLRGQGHADAGPISTQLLNQLPDQTGHSATCSSNPPPSATAPVSAKLTPTPAPPAPPTVTPAPPTVTPAPPTVTPVPQQTWTEQEGDFGANSFSNPHNASGTGPYLAAMAYVQVSCKLYDPTIVSVNPDGYWYRIASVPWNNQYYIAANTFWNGDIPGQKPYTHNTDWNVPNC